MRNASKYRAILIAGAFGASMVFQTTSIGQTPVKQLATPVPAATPPALPLTSQVKKTVVYLRSDCLHDFTIELTDLTRAKLTTMTLPDEVRTVWRLVMLTSRLKLVRASAAKLDAEDMERLQQQFVPTNDPEQLAVEGVWRASILLRMTGLSSAEVRGMTAEELDLIPADQHLGTGFFVAFPDARFKAPVGDNSSPRGFLYLITNRHVVQPGIEVGKPCGVQLGSFVIVNHKADASHSSIYAQTISIDPTVVWTVSTDESVDLAVTSIPFSEDLYDYFKIPISFFITHNDLRNKTAVEGDPVLFSGLFIQTFNQEVSTLDPIVRSGTLAMVPDGPLPTTMNRRLGHVLLADAHVFGGNSGSPVFVDTAHFSGGVGYAYKLLGVISGEVFENADLTFSVTTSITANVGANSDVSMVVPAWQILDILDLPSIKANRDSYFAELAALTNSNPDTVTALPKR